MATLLSFNTHLSLNLCILCFFNNCLLDPHVGGTTSCICITPLFIFFVTYHYHPLQWIYLCNHWGGGDWAWWVRGDCGIRVARTSILNAMGIPNPIPTIASSNRQILHLVAKCSNHMPWNPLWYRCWYQQVVVWKCLAKFSLQLNCSCHLQQSLSLRTCRFRFSPHVGQFILRLLGTRCPMSWWCAWLPICKLAVRCSSTTSLSIVGTSYPPHTSSNLLFLIALKVFTKLIQSSAQFGTSGCAHMSMVGSYPFFPVIHSPIGCPCPSFIWHLTLPEKYSSRVRENQQKYCWFPMRVGNGSLRIRIERKIYWSIGINKKMSVAVVT